MEIVVALLVGAVAGFFASKWWAARGRVVGELSLEIADIAPIRMSVQEAARQAGRSVAAASRRAI